MKKGNNTISSIFKGSQAIQKIMKGTLVVYESFKKLIASGVPPITLTKCKGVDDGKYLLDYKIYGNSVQNGTPTPETPIEVESVGVKTSNLFDINNFIETFTPYFTSNNWKPKIETFDGYECLSLWGGANADGRAIKYMQGVFKENTQYTFSLDIYDIFSTANGLYGASLTIWYTDGTKGVPILGERKIEKEWIHLKTTSELGKSIDYIQLGYNTGSGQTYIKEFQIEEGNVETKYEPYGYKIPVKTRGKNIMPLNTYNSVSVWATKIIDMKELLKDMKPGKQYTISGDFICESVPNGVDSTTIGFQFVKKNAPSMIALTNAYRINLGEKVHISKSFTLPEDTDIDSYYGLYAYMNYSSTAKAGCSGRIENIQIEEGNEETEYTPYIEPITTNIYLKEPLRKVGDYKDYIDFENQKVVKNVKEFVIDENTTIKNYTYNNNMDVTYHFNIIDYGNEHIEPKTDMFCNILPSGDLSMNYDATDSFITTRYTVDKYPFYAQIEKALIDSYEGDTIDNKFKNFLLEHNAKMYLCKKTPTEETIELPSIPTHKGTSVIEIDTDILPSNMEVEYIGKE